MRWVVFLCTVICVAIAIAIGCGPSVELPPHGVGGFGGNTSSTGADNVGTGGTAGMGGYGGLPVVEDDAGAVMVDASADAESDAGIIVNYCDIGMEHVLCWLPNNEVGVCISPGVCTWTCDLFTDCPIWECHERVCDDGACHYPNSDESVLCGVNGFCLNGVCSEFP